jgi:hypothetical protein
LLSWRCKYQITVERGSQREPSLELVLQLSTSCLSLPGRLNAPSLPLPLPLPLPILLPGGWGWACAVQMTSGGSVLPTATLKRVFLAGVLNHPILSFSLLPV